MKNRLPQLMLIAAGLLLLILFLKPMWSITLEAPQYPNGVTMYIHIDKINGSEPGTLQNINILNHYIGMKPIEPNAIPELTIFPYIIIGFISLAILFALINNKYLMLIWPILFFVALCMGMYDFYLWEFDYGHDLDPNAAMKFDVESYQPPLFGKKVLLNFVAKSYPHVGAFAMIVSIILAFWGSFLKFKRN